MIHFYFSVANCLIIGYSGMQIYSWRTAEQTPSRYALYSSYSYSCMVSFIFHNIWEALFRPRATPSLSWISLNFNIRMYFLPVFWSSRLFIKGRDTNEPPDTICSGLPLKIDNYLSRFPLWLAINYISGLYNVAGIDLMIQFLKVWLRYNNAVEKFNKISSNSKMIFKQISITI